MKKKVWVIIGIMGCVLIGIGAVVYTIYNKAGDYMLQEVVTSKMMEEVTQYTGVDLSEENRELTEAEIERFKSVLNIKQAQEPTSTVEDKEQGITPSSKPKEEGTVQKEAQEKPATVTTKDLKVAIKQQAEQLVGTIPSKDKASMLNLVLSNLTASDMNYLTGLVLDGVSGSDLSEAKRIALERFDQEELESVKTYYDTYKHLLP